MVFKTFDHLSYGYHGSHECHPRRRHGREPLSRDAHISHVAQLRDSVAHRRGAACMPRPIIRRDAVNEESSAWVALTRAPALDAAALSPSAREFGGGAAASSRRPMRRASAAGLPAAAARVPVAAPAARRRAAERRWLEDPRHHLVAVHRPALSRPAALGRRDCPLALYVAGNLDALERSATGHRRQPQPDARKAATPPFEFAEYLAARGLAITSGLAVGHRQRRAPRRAARRKESPLAVLGSGVDVDLSAQQSAPERGNSAARAP